MTDHRMTEFEELAGKDTKDNIFTDMWYFFRESKKWWMVPLVLVLLLLGGLMLLSGTAAAPFIYTLF
jgi:Family of unknown function (DUF5989)